ncbi:MAG: hypothetical protein IKR64_02395 [Treponema sp.]|nr:hypothetical protein [Treponema sp.]
MKTFKKLGLLLTLLTALLFITACPGPNTNSGDGSGSGTDGQVLSEYTVTISTMEGNQIKEKEYKVKAAEGLNTISGLTDPTLEGYDFLGYFTEKGTKFEKTYPIQTNLRLFARFEKKAQTNTSDDGKTTTTQSELTNADNTTSTKTETTTKNDDNSTTTEITIITKDENDKKVSEENTTTTTYENGESTSSSTITHYDENENPVSTVEVETTVTVDEGGKETEVKTTTETDSQGNTSTETQTTVTNEDGESETTTTQTDPEGNTTVIVSPNTSVHTLIESGIGCLAGKIPNIDSAQDYFKRAYEQDPNDNEAKVYSALADITSITTNSKIKQFFEDHLGITNYPSTPNALISGRWFMEGEYESTRQDDFEGYIVTKVDDPKEDEWYWYKVKPFYGYDQGEYSYSDGESASDQGDSGDKGPVVVETQYYDYKTITVDSKTYYVDSSTKAKVEENLEGYSIPMFGGVGVKGYNSSSPSRSKYVIADDTGYYWAELPAFKAGNATPYNFKYANVEYDYSVTILGPVFKELENQAWFTIPKSRWDYAMFLMMANLVHGNINGLDPVIDDLYAALFDSDEYKNAARKINAINGPVLLPDEVVAAYGLEEYFGEDDVTVGATELKLIKSALDVFKGLFEYLQCYSFSTNLSFLETDWTMFMSEVQKSGKSSREAAEEDDEGMPPAMEYVFNLISAYNEDIDPIANGFLSVRNPSKMEACKATFIGVLDSLIASYDSITGTSSNYPAAVGEYLKTYSILRNAAAELKTAIQNGGKFYIPMDKEQPKAWPIAGGLNTLTLDCGKLFNPGQFALSNLIELEDGKPVVYADMTAASKITSTQALLDLMKQAGEDEEEIGEEEDKEGPGLVYFKNKIGNALYEVLNIPDLKQGREYIEVPAVAALFVYNFYYGGLKEEEVAGLFTMMFHNEVEDKPAANENEPTISYPNTPKDASSGSSDGYGGNN